MAIETCIDFVEFWWIELCGIVDWFRLLFVWLSDFDLVCVMNLGWCVWILLWLWCLWFSCVVNVVEFYWMRFDLALFGSRENFEGWIRARWFVIFRMCCLCRKLTGLIEEEETELGLSMWISRDLVEVIGFKVFVGNWSHPNLNLKFLSFHSGFCMSTNDLCMLIWF